MILYYIFETTIEESEVGGDDPDKTLTTDLVESTDHLFQHCLATLGDQLCNISPRIAGYNERRPRDGGNLWSSLLF